MDIKTSFINFNTKGNTHIIDITELVKNELKKCGFSEGSVNLFAIGSTTGLSTIEFEPGLVNHDVAAMFEKIAPYGPRYEHNATWGDDNGAAHLRSTLMGTHIVVPFLHGDLILGTWQQIIFIDFDTRPRSRKVAVQILGKE
jgi:secondary thiamine-phosphate synthase enzyme